ncbi:hypothetical protein IW261DRAFT_1521328 [Armillaria novae-zelandiae]|uniref:Uncharacterized protein n=1 Tax=Armillaria novae-zelandiae TaxID=153914 RepID=A0AA39T5V8_9AGAR|nr:hypothetical protein IW261DRAFT_1521328 [Armillaria novae-zelandiae]
MKPYAPLLVRYVLRSSYLYIALCSMRLLSAFPVPSLRTDPEGRSFLQRSLASLHQTTASRNALSTTSIRRTEVIICAPSTNVDSTSLAIPLGPIYMNIKSRNGDIIQCTSKSNKFSRCSPENKVQGRYFESREALQGFTLTNF